MDKGATGILGGCEFVDDQEETCDRNATQGRATSTGVHKFCDEHARMYDRRRGAHVDGALVGDPLVAQKKTCPNDTNGDENCGRPLCPHCGDKGAQKKVVDEPMLQFFHYEHLHPALQTVSKPFCELALATATGLPRNPERTVCLRKLLEAKDCAVRALIYQS
jgi:hypothetical protein